MFRQIATAFARSRATLLADMVGGAALMVALFAGLLLPVPL